MAFQGPSYGLSRDCAVKVIEKIDYILDKITCPKILFGTVKLNEKWQYLKTIK